MTDEVILESSDEAAHFRTDIPGWVSRGGFFYGNNEAEARRDGATHVLCSECEEVCMKGRTVCDACSSAKRAPRYAAMEKVHWNEVGALYSLAAERYFFSWEDVNDYIDQNDDGDDTDYASLLLVICEPVYLDPIDYDFWADDLPEDTDLSPTVCAALDAFNAVLRAEGPVSWTPGKTRPNI